MLKRKILGNGKRYIYTYSSISRRNIQKVEYAKVLEPKVNLPENKKKLQQKPPFLKNLFIGKFDTDFLTFPEPQGNERYESFLQWMKPIENYVSSLTSNEINRLSKNDALETLKELGILQARIPKNYDGLGTTNVETLKIMETLGPMTWLIKSFVKNNITPVDVISKYGNEMQKKKYLPKIGSGDMLPTICVTEVSSGPNVQNIETKATLSKCGNFWILNGTKTFVANGIDSNIFLVIACCTENINILQDNALSAFIVETSHGGITCSDVVNTVSQQGLQICTVNFKDTRVPKENILGEINEGTDILADVFAPGNNNTAGEAIGILKHFLSLLNKNILGRRHLDKNMYEFEAVKNVVSSITCTLYSMESVAYFTNSINDVYENQDLELERAVMEMYCSNKCVQEIYKGLQIIGVDSYLNSNPYMRLYMDALGLTIYDGSVIDEKIYIALLGLQHIGKNFHKEIKEKILSSFFHFFKQIIRKREVINLNLFEYLHPSFRLAADILENCVYKLMDTSIKLLGNYGTEIASKQILIQRLADIATETYVLVAVLSRASRSYCIGVRNAEQERHIAMCIANNTQESVQKLEKDVIDELNYKDELMKMISDAVFQEKGYICQNPLTRTF